MNSVEIELIVAVLLFGVAIGYFLGRRRRSNPGPTLELTPIAEDADEILVRPLSAEQSRSLVPLPLEAESLSRLSAVVQHIPGVGVGLATATSRLYELSFSPEIAKELGTSLSHMKSLNGGIRAAVVGSGGKIAGQGTLHSVEFLKTAAASAAVWQVLSIAVAQKHLADIEKQLQAIACGVRGIQKWLHHEQQGKLEGNLKYLSNITVCFFTGRISDDDLRSYRAQLEEIDRETTQIACALELEFSHLQSRLPGIELTERFGTKHDTETIRSEIREHERLSKAWYLAMLVRAAGCQLSCAFPGERQVAERRLAAIQAALQGSKQWKASTPLFQDLIEKRLDSMFNLKSTLDERRKQLRTEVEALHDWVTGRESEISANLGRIRDRLVNGDSLGAAPLRIAIEVNAVGELIRVSRVVDGPS